MTTGTIIFPTVVKDTSGRIVIDARLNDRVEGNGTTVITKLTRSGVVKYSGYAYMTWTGFVKIDGAVEPPPEPPVEAGSFPRRFKLINTDNGTSADYVKVE